MKLYEKILILLIFILLNVALISGSHTTNYSLFENRNGINASNYTIRPTGVLIFGDGSIQRTASTGLAVDKSASGFYLHNDTTTIFLNGTRLNLTIFQLDTNETSRFTTLVGTDCSGTDKVVGVNSNGALLCVNDNNTLPYNATYELAYNASYELTFNGTYNAILNSGTLCSGNNKLVGFTTTGIPVCMTDNNTGIVSLDLSNYALVNESEVFTLNLNVTGNVTIRGNTTLHNINATGNIDIKGFFLGDISKTINYLFSKLDFTGTTGFSDLKDDLSEFFYKTWNANFGTSITPSTANATVTFKGTGGIDITAFANTIEINMSNSTNVLINFTTGAVINRLNITTNVTVPTLLDCAVLNTSSTGIVQCSFDDNSGADGSFNLTYEGFITNANNTYQLKGIAYNSTYESTFNATYLLNYNSTYELTFNGTYNAILNSGIYCSGSTKLVGFTTSGTPVCMTDNNTGADGSFNITYENFINTLNNTYPRLNVFNIFDREILINDNLTIEGNTTVKGNLTAYNINLTGNIDIIGFYLGDGSLLRNLKIYNVTYESTFNATYLLNYNATYELAYNQTYESTSNSTYETFVANANNSYMRTLIDESISGRKNFTSGIVVRYLNITTNLTLYGFASCNLDTDSNGNIICGTDAGVQDNTNIAFLNNTQSFTGENNFTNVTIRGNLTAYNINTTGNIQGTFFLGDGNLLRNLQIYNATYELAFNATYLLAYNVTYELNFNTTYNNLINSGTLCSGNNKLVGFTISGVPVCMTDNNTGTAGLDKNATGYYLYNETNTIFFNGTALNITIEQLDTDTTYTAGSNLSLVGAVFHLNTTTLKTWLDTLYQAITSAIFDKNTTGFYLYNNTNTIFFNDTRLNITIKQLDTNDSVLVNVHEGFITNANNTYQLKGIAYNVTYELAYNSTYEPVGANVSTITCSGTDKISAINNVTGVVTCSVDAGGASLDLSNYLLKNQSVEVTQAQYNFTNVTIKGNLTVYNINITGNSDISGFYLGDGSRLRNLQIYNISYESTFNSTYLLNYNATYESTFNITYDDFIKVINSSYVRISVDELISGRKNFTNGIVVRYLNVTTNLTLYGFASCNLDTDVNGNIICGSDATGATSLDLTNYALTNQSESFDLNVNITGNLTNRLGDTILNKTNITHNLEVNPNFRYLGNVSLTVGYQWNRIVNIVSDFSDDIDNVIRNWWMTINGDFGSSITPGNGTTLTMKGGSGIEITAFANTIQVNLSNSTGVLVNFTTGGVINRLNITTNLTIPTLINCQATNTSAQGTLQCSFTGSGGTADGSFNATYEQFIAQANNSYARLSITQSFTGQNNFTNVTIKGNLTVYNINITGNVDLSGFFLGDGSLLRNLQIFNATYLLAYNSTYESTSNATYERFINQVNNTHARLNLTNSFQNITLQSALLLERANTSIIFNGTANSANITMNTSGCIIIMGKSGGGFTAC